MLVLSRKIGEEIIIADHVRVKIVSIQGNRVKLGVVAPEDVTIHREEIHRVRQEFNAPISETMADDASDHASIVHSR